MISKLKILFTRIQEKMEAHYKILTNAGLLLLEIVAEAWGARTDLFTEMFDPGHLSTFRLIHYPDRGDDLPDCVKKDGYSESKF